VKGVVVEVLPVVGAVTGPTVVLPVDVAVEMVEEFPLGMTLPDTLEVEVVVPWDGTA